MFDLNLCFVKDDLTKILLYFMTLSVLTGRMSKTIVSPFGPLKLYRPLLPETQSLV